MDECAAAVVCFWPTFSFIVVVVRRGCDFVQMLGFLMANVGCIFGLAVGGLLYTA
jgi:hypothetical protein